MNPILTIAGAALREHSRRKLLLVFSVISVVLMLGVIFLLVRSHETGGVFGTKGFLINLVSTSVMQFLALIATLAFSMGNIGQPFANGEAALVLARPVTRAQFALGRYLGSAVAIIGFCALLGAETQVAQILSGQSVSIELWGHWATVTFNLLVIAALTTLLSVVFSTSIIAAVLGYFCYQIVGGVSIGHALVRSHQVTGLVAKFLEGLWFLAPKFLTSPLVDSASRLAGGTPRSTFFVPNSLALAIWAALYLAGMLVVLVFLVRRKEVA